jgi:nitrogen fixation NifU-like protein
MLRELYQEMIIDHGRHPRNFGPLPNANHHKEGFNPLCGDKIHVHVQEHNGMVEKIQFEGAGCAISMASASLMSEVLQGKTITEIDEIFTAFHHLVTDGEPSDKLGKLAVLGGVREFPVRVKCATLAWHTLKAALINDSQPVTTEETS